MKRCYKLLSLLLALTLLASGAGLFAGLFTVPAQAADGTWVSCWGSSLVNGSATVAGMQFHDVIPLRTTLRTELTVTTAGTELSFVFSNQYGSADVTITAASVAKSDTSAKNNVTIEDGTQTPITFDGGQTGVTIPKGKRVQSDKIPFETYAMETICLSLYFAHTTYMTSVGLSNGRTFMQSASSQDRINSVTLNNAREVNIGSGAITYHTIPFLERIDTLSQQSGACTAVFIGDSTLVNDTYLYYARRVVSAGVRNVSVINEAIIGNKLLSDGSGIIGNLYGQAMRDRFQRDVLDIPGVKYCFVKIGLNDVLHQFSKTLGEATPKNSPETIIEGYRDLIRRCHERNIKIYFFTKSPWKGYERNFLGSGVDITWTQQEQDMCDKLTKWVLTNTEADGAIDCSPLANPADPYALCPSFTPDGAHLTDIGSIAMADLIPLEYVGVPKGKGRTAADITSTDPYKEKRQIQQRLDRGELEPTQPTTQRQQPTTQRQQPATQQPATQQPVTQQPVTQPPVTQQPATQPSEPYATAPYTQDDPNGGNGAANPNANNPTYVNPYDAQQQNVTYNTPANTPAAVNATGSGTNVGFLLIFGLAMVVAVATVILTMMRKKEN